MAPRITTADYEIMSSLKTQIHISEVLPPDPSERSRIVRCIALAVIGGLIATAVITTLPHGFAHTVRTTQAIAVITTLSTLILGGAAVIYSATNGKGAISGHDHWFPISMIRPMNSRFLSELKQAVENSESNKPADLESIITSKYKTENSVEFVRNNQLVLIIHNLLRLGTTKDESLKNTSVWSYRDMWEHPAHARDMKYLDFSTIETGECAIYNYKPTVNNEIISSRVILTAPLHVALSMIGNGMRMVARPLLLAYRGQWRQIPSEINGDIWRIVRAPFYGVAMIAAALYTFIDAKNGIKVGALVENQWNDKAPVHLSTWAMVMFAGTINSIRNRSWKDIRFRVKDSYKKTLEGGGLYFPACWQPVAIAKVKEREITQIRGYSHYFSDKNQNFDDYEILYRTDTVAV